MNSLRYFDFGSSRSPAFNCPHCYRGPVYYFRLSQLTGFSGTVQYMTSLGAPMPMLAAIIAVVMEVPAAILIVLGFFTRPRGDLCLLYAGNGGDWSPLLGYDGRCGPAKYD